MRTDLSVNLEFYDKDTLVDIYPQKIKPYGSATPSECVQDAFNSIRDYEGFIQFSGKPFDRISMQWPDGTKYTWEAILIKHSFDVSQKLLDRLILE